MADDETRTIVAVFEVPIADEDTFTQVLKAMPSSLDGVRLVRVSTVASAMRIGREVDASYIR